MSLHRIAAALLVLLPSTFLHAQATGGQAAANRGGAAAPRISAGTFVAARIDRDSLPQTDRVVDEDGTTYVIVFDRLVLSLRGDGSFRASLRYRRTLYSSDLRGRDRSIPLQTMAVTGKYEVVGTEVRFTPDQTEETRGLRMLAGTVVSAREITVPFQYRNGTRERDRRLVMRRDDNIF